MSHNYVFQKDMWTTSYQSAWMLFNYIHYIGGLSHSHVCGRIRGYQVGSTSAFRPASSQGIDSYYVDGVSLTHGGAGSRQHIWTFAAGLSENTTTCTVLPVLSVALVIPQTVEVSRASHSLAMITSVRVVSTQPGMASMLYFILMMSSGMVRTVQPSISTCCQFNNPPWFTKNLTNATTDDIELRICAENQYGYEDVAIELVELYVQ